MDVEGRRSGGGGGGGGGVDDGSFYCFEVEKRSSRVRSHWRKRFMEFSSDDSGTGIAGTGVAAAAAVAAPAAMRFFDAARSEVKSATAGFPTAVVDVPDRRRARKHRVDLRMADGSMASLALKSAGDKGALLAALLAIQGVEQAEHGAPAPAAGGTRSAQQAARSVLLRCKDSLMPVTQLEAEAISRFIPCYLTMSEPALRRRLPKLVKRLQAKKRAPPAGRADVALLSWADGIHSTGAD